MLGYIQNLFARLFAYIYDICSRKPVVTEQELAPLDPRETIIEDYMKDKELKELNAIYHFVRKRKENDVKRKCKLR